MTSSAPVSTPLAGIVIAGHGGFAAGALDAVERVAGPQPRAATVSNHGLDAAGIEAALIEAVDRVRADVIFTDLPAGSCTIAARRLAKQRGTLTVVTGANLPMLLDHCCKGREGAEGAALSAAKGRDSVMVFAPEHAPTAHSAPNPGATGATDGR